MVMLSGSPPNERMFLCTQPMAACWSHRPDVSKGNPPVDVHGTAEPKTDFLAPHHTSLCGDYPELQSDVVDLSSIVEQSGRLIRQEVAIDHRRQGQVVEKGGLKKKIR
ncbi:hypothetical protein EYF80_046255 [Liparis tanakae]|uniref:Uncharacterized protein n=1 Tax=Liparis tanakae TaxID=230148 RepID=A0A4Z2FS06_9TELE|nr:hypothetical protein EYF80_046255 [Liparis tanakae]